MTTTPSRFVLAPLLEQNIATSVHRAGDVSAFPYPVISQSDLFIDVQLLEQSKSGVEKTKPTAYVKHGHD